MRKSRTTNWKTTLLGCLLAAAVAIEPIITTGDVDWKRVALSGLIAAFSFAVKDRNVTGGTRQQ
jgi:hypothetical protein